MKKKRTVKPKVKKIKLRPETVLRVEAPSGTTPAIMPDPTRNAVEIRPVPKTWWERTFGN